LMSFSWSGFTLLLFLQVCYLSLPISVSHS
jgi:hypothetical protein